MIYCCWWQSQCCCILCALSIEITIPIGQVWKRQKSIAKNKRNTKILKWVGTKLNEEKRGKKRRRIQSHSNLSRMKFSLFRDFVVCSVHMEWDAFVFFSSLQTLRNWLVKQWETHSIPNRVFLSSLLIFSSILTTNKFNVCPYVNMMCVCFSQHSDTMLWPVTENQFQFVFGVRFPALVSRFHHEIKTELR